MPQACLSSDLRFMRGYDCVSRALALPSALLICAFHVSFVSKCRPRYLIDVSVGVQATGVWLMFCGIGFWLSRVKCQLPLVAPGKKTKEPSAGVLRQSGLVCSSGRGSARPLGTSSVSSGAPLLRLSFKEPKKSKLKGKRSPPRANWIV